MSDILTKDKQQQDLFVCDVADAVLKDIMPAMEHPFFSLSKKPDTKVRRYVNGDNWLEIIPTIKGAATIYDKDILIYAISQIMAKINRGEKVSQHVRINCNELLMFANRGNSGDSYMRLQDALDRLDGTRIRTNIHTGDEEQWNAFGLIDSAATRRKNGIDGRLLWCEIKISDWVFKAIEKKEVLTLNRDYFRLSKPTHRRIYEIARKHCGQQRDWTISLKKLHIKTGSQSKLIKFRFVVKEIEESNQLPDYTLRFDPQTDNVVFKNRTQWWDSNDKPYPQIKNKETYQTAKGLCPVGVDVYAVEQEWFDYWKGKGRLVINDPDRAFLGFVSKKFLTDIE